MPKSRVLIAMSGGVDSSVAAYLLNEQGYKVIGITLQIWPKEQNFQENFNGCCSLLAVDDAKKVCAKIGIPHYVLNFREVFEKKVIKNFIEEYQNGRTPNPCIRCNQFIKFNTLLKKAKELECDYVATGHYARIKYEIRNTKYETNSKFEIRNSKQMIYRLLKGIDPQKDQSYVLYMLNQKNLPRILFPLGNLTKKKVRKLAKQYGLPTAEKPESQEICFIPDNDYTNFLKTTTPRAFKTGPIFDTNGKILGMHNGIVNFTIGQRKGLGISKPYPLYVTKINPKNNSITVGKEDDTFTKELMADEINFIHPENISTLPRNLKIKIRSTADAVPAKVIPLEKNKIKVNFEKPQKAVTPGQAVVFYDEDEVIGGGTIC